MQGRRRHICLSVPSRHPPLRYSMSGPVPGRSYATIRNARFGEYSSYRAYVSANLGWRKALLGALVWLAGMFAPLGAKAFSAVAELGGDNVDDWLGIARRIFLRPTECGNTTALRVPSSGQPDRK